MYFDQKKCSSIMENYQRQTLEFIKKTWMQEQLFELFESVTDDFLYESPLTNAKGFEWFAKYVESVKSGFSNIDLSFRNIYSDDRSSVAYYTVSAKHTGVILGIEPSGNKVKFDVFTYLEFEESEVRYMRSVFDVFELKTQMGIR